MTSWIFANPMDARLGEPVPAEALDVSGGFGDRGLVRADGEMKFVESVPPDDVGDEVQRRRGAAAGSRTGAAPRLHNSYFDVRLAVAMMREEDRPHWTFDRPRAGAEYLDAIVAGSGNSSSYHVEWQRLCGVSGGSAVFHDHRLILEVIRAAACVGQLDLNGPSFAKSVVRRAVHLGTAVEHNPRHPDFSGLAVVEGGAATGRGNVRVPPRFREHITARQLERITVLKHARMYREEQGKGRQGRHAGDDDGGFHTASQSSGSGTNGRGRGAAGRGKKLKGDGGSRAAGAHDG